VVAWETLLTVRAVACCYFGASIIIRPVHTFLEFAKNTPLGVRVGLWCRMQAIKGEAEKSAIELFNEKLSEGEKAQLLPTRMEWVAHLVFNVLQIIEDVLAYFFIEALVAEEERITLFYILWALLAADAFLRMCARCTVCREDDIIAEIVLQSLQAILYSWLVNFDPKSTGIFCTFNIIQIFLGIYLLRASPMGVNHDSGMRNEERSSEFRALLSESELKQSMALFYSAVVFGLNVLLLRFDQDSPFRDFSYEFTVLMLIAVSRVDNSNFVARVRICIPVRGSLIQAGVLAVWTFGVVLSSISFQVYSFTLVVDYRDETTSTFEDRYIEAVFILTSFAFTIIGLVCLCTCCLPFYNAS